MNEEETKEISGEEAAPVAVEQKNAGSEAQEAAETEQKDENPNWASARDTMKLQKETIEQQNQLVSALKSELDQLKGSKPTKEASNTPLDGQDDDDLLTVKDVKKLFSDLNRQWSLKIGEVSARSKYADMEDVINKYGKSLPDSVKYAVIKADNPHLAAYEACVNSAAYYKDQVSSETSEAAKKVEKNLKKPGSASSVGNAGALSKASYYESIDDAQLLAESQKYIFGR